MWLLKNFRYLVSHRNLHEINVIMNKVFMTIFAMLLLAVLPSFIGNAEANPNQTEIEMSFVDVTEAEAFVADHKPIGVKTTASIGEAFAKMGGDDNKHFENAIIPSRFNGTYLEGNMIHLNDYIESCEVKDKTPAFIKRE